MVYKRSGIRKRRQTFTIVEPNEIAYTAVVSSYESFESASWTGNQSMSVCVTYVYKDVFTTTALFVFYDQLDKLVGSCPKYDAIMILGDFNAKVGSGSGTKETVRRFSLHRESNDNGSRLTDFALSRGLVVSSHLGTWKKRTMF